MEKQKPVYYQSVEKCVDDIIDYVGRNIVFGMPLALGKPNQLANELYRRAKADPSINLTIMTALSLEKPIPSSEIERRMLEPIIERIWKDYPDFEYMQDIRNGGLPPNVELSEFYFKAGGYLNVPHAQQNYVSSNYTHVARDAVNAGVNVFGHIVAKQTIDGKPMVSASCNADIIKEVFDLVQDERKKGKKIVGICQINNNLPFMYGDAVAPPDLYDMVIEAPEYDFPLFSVPKVSVTGADHMIGMYVSSLIKDSGTLQIGIGSLGDAIAAGLEMRHTANSDYNAFLRDAGLKERYDSLIEAVGGTGVFKEGLYGSSEMLVEVFMELYEAGILKRKVYENEAIQKLINEGRLDEKIPENILEMLLEEEAVYPVLREKDFNMLQSFGILRDNLAFSDGVITNGSSSYSADLTDPDNMKKISENALGDSLKNGLIMHGAFFIGSKKFYDTLNGMGEDERKLFSMTGVENVNQLYNNQALKALQRKNARFVNAGMKVTLSGAIVSDGLENGEVVSGVGGQYNFVAMAHAIEDARLVMMIRSTKTSGSKTVSNIVFNYGHITVPRHLRDIVVTEYGIADLRGKRDKEIIAELLNIADSRFQDELLMQARKAGKIADDYEIPEKYRNNYPDRIEATLKPYRDKGYFRPFPFGSDFTDEEIVLGKSLREFKAKAGKNKLKTVSGLLKQVISSNPDAAYPYLRRLGLDQTESFKETLMQKVVVYALREAGQI